MRYVEVDGRTKIAVNNHIYESIPNPTFEVVAPPGSFADYFAGKNPEGKTLREIAGTPMRSIDAFRSAEPRLKLLDELGIDAALMFPTLASLVEVNLLDDPEVTCTIVHAYNQWLHDEWPFDYKQRIFTTPVVNPCIPEQGIAELEWVLERGAKVVLLRPGAVAGTAAPAPRSCRPSTSSGARSRTPACWWPCTPRTPATSGTPTSGRARTAP